MTAKETITAIDSKLKETRQTILNVDNDWSPQTLVKSLYYSDMMFLVRVNDRVPDTFIYQKKNNKWVPLPERGYVEKGMPFNNINEYFSYYEIYDYPELNREVESIRYIVKLITGYEKKEEILLPKSLIQEMDFSNEETINTDTTIKEDTSIKPNSDSFFSKQNKVDQSSFFYSNQEKKRYL